MLEAFRLRMFIYGGFIGFGFLIIFLQLLNLQVIQGKSYADRARLNMENNIPILASRGEMYDRNFKRNSAVVTIASNRSTFNLTTILSKFATNEERKQTLRNLAILLNISETSLMNEITGKSQWERIVLAEDVNFDVVVTIASHSDLFKNIDWEDAPVRVYNHGQIFSHLAGYVGSISPAEHAKLKDLGYKNYHKIGKTGIESQYDSILRGKDGYIRRIVDVRNRVEDEEIGKLPSAGNNIVLTIDYGVQKTAYDAMEGNIGGVVALKPSTGEVLAMVSKPDFDPNMLISKNNADIVKELESNRNHPFINRNIQSRYPPASTFKLMTAIAALETEKAVGETTYYCPGKYTLKGYKDRDFYCYEGHSHGTLNLYNAIGHSCNVYFYNLGYRTGPTNIIHYAGYFGLNEKTGIDLSGEISGFLPSRQWKQKTFGEPWYDGDTINLSIGQGFISMTPIGMANLVAAIVNNGIVYRPHVIKEIRNADNSVITQSIEREKIREIPLSLTSLDIVKTGMRLGASSGTSARLNSLKFPVAGKTGTVQTRSTRKDKYSQHAWFVGYGPYNAEPEKIVVVVVFVEYGIAGAVHAVPVAERVFNKLYDLGYF
ncbi:MAG: penicillin-binding protein 2 [Leptospirales bacterium]|nr:penicillin-binding protein 2 [Leptospirales bacterium]